MIAKRLFVLVFFLTFGLTLEGCVARGPEGSAQSDRAFERMNSRETDHESAWEKIDTVVYGILGVGAAAAGIILPLKLWK